MIYYVAYETCIGYNIYSEIDLLYMDKSIDDLAIEYEGSEEDCMEYLDNIE